MNKDLIIVFAKNPKKGFVKTRLAKAIGDDAAFNVYLKLLDITESESLKVANCDIHVYFTSHLDDSRWKGKQQYIQSGNDLGERMEAAFQEAFNQGYKNVIGIGTDLPDLNAELMSDGLNSLKESDTVFGPSLDGGYYLLGMNQMINQIFDNKPWSTESLLNETKSELEKLDYSIVTLPTLNDIDTIDDLKASSLKL